MADYDSVENVQSLAPNEISKMTNAQLKRALTAIVIARREEEPTNSVILDEIRKLHEEVAEIKGLKQEVKHLSTRLDDAYTVIHNQQLYLEFLDGKERRRNLIITGLNEDADEAGSTDVDKVKAVLHAAGYHDSFDIMEWEIRRLGQENERKKRPMHVTVTSQQQRDSILRVAKNLKQAAGVMARVYMKKDVHPAVRKEQARLRTREREEKEKPANTGTNIRYDWKNRVLLRDDVVIDRFSPAFF